jgi:putative FmdB family regulatory protein
MPIYEYRCDGCGERTEHIQRISDAPISKCTSCGSGGIRRLISSTNFVLKGSGWHATDYDKNKLNPRTPPAKGGQ